MKKYYFDFKHYDLKNNLSLWLKENNCSFSPGQVKKALNKVVNKHYSDSPWESCVVNKKHYFKQKKASKKGFKILYRASKTAAKYPYLYADMFKEYLSLKFKIY